MARRGNPDSVQGRARPGTGQTGARTPYRPIFVPEREEQLGTFTPPERAAYRSGLDRTLAYLRELFADHPDRIEFGIISLPSSTPERPSPVGGYDVIGIVTVPGWLTTDFRGQTVGVEDLPEPELSALFQSPAR